MGTGGVTVTDPTTDREIKICCAAFYQSDIVRMLLGDIFHPGGLALTRHLGEVIGLGPGDRVLDVACGRGASAIHLAEQFGCHVTGLDYGPENVAAAQAHAADRGVTNLTTFRQGDAEGLPFDDGSFDAVVSECSFCTFPDKATAAAEMARVLRCPEPAEGSSAGRLGLTDMTVSGPLPDDIQSLLAWVACVAGAGTPEDYVATLREAGFTDFTVKDRRDALLEMVDDVRRKLLGVELAVGLGKLNLGDGSTERSTERSRRRLAEVLDLSEGKRLARRAVELIEEGSVGYTLIAARLET
jgi:arsenite methyltransferase